MIKNIKKKNLSAFVRLFIASVLSFLLDGFVNNRFISWGFFDPQLDLNRFLIAERGEMYWNEMGVGILWGTRRWPLGGRSVAPGFTIVFIAPNR